MNARDAASRIKRRARRAGVEVGPHLADSLGVYLELLARWNEKINLTSLQDPDEAVDRLVVEPLVAARYLPSHGTSLLDIGSGGGSPALPLRLASPSLRLCMVEAKTRKAAFLREAVRVLGLSDVTVETHRYEELLARPELHEGVETISLRAVRVEMATLMSLQAFLKVEGRILWFRGPSGPAVPANLMPPLVWDGTYPLVEWLRSRLIVLRKATIGTMSRPAN